MDVATSTSTSTSTSILPTSVTTEVATTTTTATPTPVTTIPPHASPTLSYGNCSYNYTNEVVDYLYGSGDPHGGVFVGPVNNVSWPVIRDCCSNVSIELWGSGSCAAACDFDLANHPGVNPRDLLEQWRSYSRCIRRAQADSEDVEDSIYFVNGAFYGPSDEDSAVRPRVGGSTLSLMTVSLLLSLVVGGMFAV